MQKYLFIVNPRAGKQKDITKQLDQILQHHPIIYNIITTTHRGHANHLCQDLAHQYDIVVAVGGDGTINEVINGIANHNVTLGIIALGSGNDFARSFALPINNINAAIKALLKGHTNTIDLGEINGIRFINAVGIGFDGYANHISQQLAWITGGLKYYCAIVIAFFRYRSLNVTITTPNHKTTTPLFMLSINNGTYVGNGLPTAPTALLDDGQLNMVEIKHIRPWRLLTQFPKLSQGKINEISEVTHNLITNISIQSSQPLPIHYDGEALRNTKEAHIKVIPNALKIIY